MNTDRLALAREHYQRLRAEHSLATRTAIAEPSDPLRMAHAYIADLEAELQRERTGTAADSRAGAAEAKVEAAEARAEEAEARLATANACTRQAEADLTAARASITALETENATLRAERDSAMERALTAEGKEPRVVTVEIPAPAGESIVIPQPTWEPPPARPVPWDFVRDGAGNIIRAVPVLP